MKRLALMLASTILAAGCAQTPFSPSPPAPQAVAPQPSQAVRDAQVRLRDLGFYNGPIDGLHGPDTEAAIERFQRARGVAVNGQLDPPTRDALRAEQRSSVAPAFALNDRASVERVQARLQQLGFYHGPVDGGWGPDTQAALRRFQGVRGLDVTGEPTPATMSALNLGAGSPQVASVGQPLDPGVMRDIQRRLRRAGYYNGPIDGRWGPRGEAAVERFQRSRNLQPTGELNPTTLSALGFDPNNLSGGYGSSAPR